MNYIRLLYAIFIGALMTVATRFGPSLTIFAFVYLSRYSSSQAYSTPMTLEDLLVYYLPAASMLAGVGAYLIRLALKTYSNKIDHNVLPFVDFLVLRHVEKWNLSAVIIRGQSVLALRIVQTVSLLLLLSGVIAIISYRLSILAFLVIVFALALAFWKARKGVNAATLAKVSSITENIIEQVMMAVMIIGCVLILPRDQWLHAAIGLFVLARFVMSYRLLGRSILQWSVMRQTKPIPARPLPFVRALPKPTTPPVIAATAPKPD